MALFRWTSGLALVACSALCSAQSLTYLLHGSHNGDRLGWSVADVADLDGDGHPDVLVGSPQDDTNGNNAGAVRAYSGKTGALIRTWTGEAAGDFFGWSVDGLADLDGDGRGDLIVGAPRHDLSGGVVNAGKVYVFSGGTGVQYTNLSLGQTNAQFGTVVRGLGDIDHDGAGDFAFGTPYYDDAAGNIDAGRIDVYSSATLGWIGVAVGTAAGDFFGYDLDLLQAGPTSTSCMLIVGAPGASIGGKACVVDATGITHSTISSAYPNAWFGWSVAGIGDITGDGTNDFAIGAPFTDTTGVDAGLVRVYRGGGGSSSLLAHLEGASAGERFGERLAGIDDYDGDGTRDFLVGLPVADDGGTDAGKVVVRSGANFTQLAVWSGTPGDALGHGVSSAGDLNLDGTRDLIFGAPYSDNSAGLASVVLCRAPQPAIYCTAKTNSLGCAPVIGYGGVPSLSIADGFHVTAMNVLNKKSGIAFWGHASSSLPFYDATLCVKAPVVRSSVLSSGGSVAGNDCTGSYTFAFTHAYMQAESLVAGKTLYAQVWSRDPGFAPPFNFGMTDALSFEVVP